MNFKNLLKYLKIFNEILEKSYENFKNSLKNLRNLWMLW